MIRRLIYSACLLVLVPAQIVFAAGFDKGAHVKAVDRTGNVVEGTLASFIGAQSIQVTDSSSHQFALPLNKIKAVSGIYGSDFTTVTGLKLTPIKVDLTDGTSMNLGYSENTMFSLDMGIKGNMAVYFPSPYRWASIEAADQKTEDKGGMTIHLKDGKTIDVPVKKEDISSIEFK